MAIQANTKKEMNILDGNNKVLQQNKTGTIILRHLQHNNAYVMVRIKKNSGTQTAQWHIFRITKLHLVNR